MMPVFIGRIREKVINYAKLDKVPNAFFELQRKYYLSTCSMLGIYFKNNSNATYKSSRD